MREAILNMGLGFAFPESVIASSILLMNDRVDTRILSEALQCKYRISETEWMQMLDKPYPLIIPCGKKEEYALFTTIFAYFLWGLLETTSLFIKILRWH